MIVGYKEHTFFKGFTAGGMNWISYEPEIGESIICGVKIRSRSPEAIGKITRLQKGRVKVEFETKQSAVTPGQACVFYEGEKVIGGGWIEEGHK